MLAEDSPPQLLRDLLVRQLDIASALLAYDLDDLSTAARTALESPRREP